MRFLEAAAVLCGFATSCAASQSFQEVVGMEPPAQTLSNSPQPCDVAESPAANASIQLSSWVECQVNSFYPYPANGDWPKAHANAFARDVQFSFNDTKYDFDGSLQLYTSFNATLGRAFAPFRHGFINTLGVPNANGDKGGFVYMIGWMGGFQQIVKRDLYFTNAAFARVADINGQRKLVEFRESSNIPNSALKPPPVEWTCNFETREW